MKHVCDYHHLGSEGPSVCLRGGWNARCQREPGNGDMAFSWAPQLLFVADAPFLHSLVRCRVTVTDKRTVRTFTCESISCGSRSTVRVFIIDSKLGR